MLRFRIDELLKKNKTRYWLVKKLNSSYPVINNLAHNKAQSVRLETLEKLMRTFNGGIEDLFKE